MSEWKKFFYGDKTKHETDIRRSNLINRTRFAIRMRWWWLKFRVKRFFKMEG